MSLLDSIKESQVDVRSVPVRYDISGSEFHFEPFEFRYMMFIPFEFTHMQNSFYVEKYVNSVKYLFDAFSDKYQVILRKTANTDLICEYFTYWSEEEQSMIPILFNTVEWLECGGGIFVQYDFNNDWSYKRTYRFLTGLTKIFDTYELISTTKRVFIFQRTIDIRGHIYVTDIKEDKTRVYIKYSDKQVIELKTNPDGKIVVDIDKSSICTESIVIAENKWDKTIFNRSIRQMTDFVNYSENERYLHNDKYFLNNRADFTMNMTLEMNDKSPTLDRILKYVKDRYYSKRKKMISKHIAK